MRERIELLRKTVSEIMLTLLICIMLTLAFNVPYVKANDSWVWVRNTVTGAYGEAVVGTGTALYIARGTSFYRYLPADNSWVELASPPKPDGVAFKTGTALAWDFGDWIYALYGAATGDSRRWFYRYNMSSNSWEALANTTADQGEGDAMTWVGIDYCVYATIGGEQRPTYFVRYDPSTNSWSNAPADPLAGMGDGASLVWTGDNFLYALRGEFSEKSPLCDFWRYSLADDVWTVMEDIPADAHDSGVGGVGDGGSLLYVGFWLLNQTDYIYALSGNQAYPEKPVIPDNRTYRYTILMNSWERLADLPFGVGYYVGCRLGYADGYIYAWQGAPSTWTGGGDDLAIYEFTPTPRTWVVDDDGPADFHTIQEAINAANSEDAIYVHNGTYYENVVVNKTLRLTAENREDTIIDARGIGDVLRIEADNVTVSNFTIQYGDNGIYLIRSHGSTIRNNNVTTNINRGILGMYSTGNNFEGNIVNNNGGQAGIDLTEDSIDNIIRDNIITNNGVGIYLRYNSGNNTVQGNKVQSNSRGINIGAHTRPSNNNTIISNIITSSGDYGILFEYCSGNDVCGNLIADNPAGIKLVDGNDNKIYHNNFIDNADQVCISISFNIWDDGYPSGGNYWSDYNSADLYSGPYQNETGSDGIGDTSHIIDENNRDRYPLMTPWSPLPIKVFGVVWQGVHYPVATLSKSTITHFIFNQTLVQISFNVSGSPGTVGYCNVTIPKNLLRGDPWTITVDGVTKTDFTQSTNDTHSFLYFTYTHTSTLHIIIQGTWVIPEFPTTLILPMFMIFSLLATVFAKRRPSRKLKN